MGRQGDDQSIYFFASVATFRSRALEGEMAITRARARPTWFRARTAASSAPGRRGPGRRRPFAGGGGRLEGAAVPPAASPLRLSPEPSTRYAAPERSGGGVRPEQQRVGAARRWLGAAERGAAAAGPGRRRQWRRRRRCGRWAHARRGEGGRGEDKTPRHAKAAPLALRWLQGVRLTLEGVFVDFVLLFVCWCVL